jgi:hypothetical protein
MADENDENPALPSGGGSSEFWEDSGPSFDPEASPDAPEPEQLTEDGQEVGWTPEGVATFLRELQAPAFNSLLNPLLGVSEVDWDHRESRLRAVAPSIAREWNKIPQIRQLAGATDRGIILNYMLVEYLGPRSFAVIGERKELARLRAEQQAIEEAEAAAAAPRPSRGFGDEPARPVRQPDEPPPPEFPGRLR